MNAKKPYLTLWNQDLWTQYTTFGSLLLRRLLVRTNFFSIGIRWYHALLCWRNIWARQNKHLVLTFRWGKRSWNWVIGRTIFLGVPCVILLSPRWHHSLTKNCFRENCSSCFHKPPAGLRTVKLFFVNFITVRHKLGVQHFIVDWFVIHLTALYSVERINFIVNRSMSLFCVTTSQHISLYRLIHVVGPVKHICREPFGCFALTHWASQVSIYLIISWGDVWSTPAVMLFTAVFWTSSSVWQNGSFLMALHALKFISFALNLVQN